MNLSSFRMLLLNYAPQSVNFFGSTSLQHTYFFAFVVYMVDTISTLLYINCTACLVYFFKTMHDLKLRMT